MALGLLLSSLAPASFAAAEPPPAEIRQLEQRVAELHDGISKAGHNIAALQALAGQANALDIDLQKCVSDSEQDVLKLETSMDGLGDPQPNETALVREERLELGKQQAHAKTLLSSCKVLLDDAAAASTDLQSRSRSLIRQKLLVRGTDLASLASRNLMDPSPWLQYFLGLGEQYRGLENLGYVSLFLLFGLILVAMLWGYLLRRLFNSWGSTRTDNEFTSVLLQSIKLCLASYVPYLLAATVASVFFLVMPGSPSDVKFWAYLSYSLATYLVLSLAIRILLNPPGQLPSATFLPQPIALGMARRLQVLMLLSLAGVVYFASQDVLNLPRTARLFGRGVVLTLFVLNVLWFVWLIGRLPALQTTGKRIRGLMAVVLVIALLAEWLGYRGLSSYLLRGLVGTLVLGTLTWMLHLILGELFSGLDRGKHQWQRSLRLSVGLADGATFPGLSTLRFLTALALWGSAALLLLRLWGMPNSFFRQLLVDFQGGFQVAGLHINPQRIVIGLVLFALLLQVFSRLRERVEQRWLVSSGMDRGAREASATVFGYAGFLVAVLVALSAAGLDLSKLAIIAGALSVGIGFGLQNIVNNFISGLILLFERPIVPGDYVSVGSTEGFVRKISIRSTEIETPERRSVIVPNSDLISGQVVNWMRHDSYGRLKIEINVAYGSDVRQVQQTLLGITKAHPEVMLEGVLAPAVTLTAFGDNAIQFTITVVVRNFAQRGTVASDINFAIDEAFRREHIEIPFRQHVVHLAQPLK